MDNYYLKHYLTRKVDTYTYEYDEWKDTMSSGKKYYVNIIFEDEKFSRVEFDKEKTKIFDTNLRQKELDLLNKLQNEIKNIEKQRLEEKYDIIKIRLKDTKEQIELMNSMVGESETANQAREVFKELFSPVLSTVLDSLKANKIPFDKLNAPSIKIKIPLEYEVEIFNQNLVQKEESQVGQGPV